MRLGRDQNLAAQVAALLLGRQLILEVDAGRARLDQPGEQAVPQAHVGLGRERQVKVRLLGRVGAAGVDDHVPLAPRPRRLHAAEEDGMGPGRVVAGEDHEVGQLQVLVAAGDQVGAEGLLVRRHRRGHAES